MLWIIIGILVVICLILLSAFFSSAEMAFISINRAVIKEITAILQYEYLYKRINLYKDTKTNFETFRTKSATRYDISPDYRSFLSYDIAGALEEAH